MKRIDTFDFNRVKGISKTEAAQLPDFSWIDKQENILFLGPAGFRLRKILKSKMFIIDEIGYTPIEKREANLFFTLISEMYEKQSIIITSNKSFSVWAEMMGDEIMTTALIDPFLHHARIFSLQGESYRIQNTKEVNAI